MDNTSEKTDMDIEEELLIDIMSKKPMNIEKKISYEFRKRRAAKESFMIGVIISGFLIFIFMARTKIVLSFWLISLITLLSGIITEKIIMKSYPRF